MAPASNPRLMARVLEAVKHLGETKGSSARQVLEIVKQGNKAPAKNLAIQVQRALKHAVTAGLLKLRGGRYKMLISLQSAGKNRGIKANGNKRSVSRSGGKKKEDIENSTETASLQPVDAGPKSRCSHCKKHKRRSSRRRRKRSSKGRRRPTKQAAERKSRKLRRRGEDEVSNRRGGRKNAPVPGTRSQSKVPAGPRAERPGKPNPETNQEQDEDMSESAGSRRDRSSSSSESEAEDEGPKTTKAKLSETAGRKTDASSHRSSSKPRRSSRKRNSQHKIGENDPEDPAMECCDDDENRGREITEEDANANSEENGGSATSI